MDLIGDALAGRIHEMTLFQQSAATGRETDQ